MLTVVQLRVIEAVRRHGSVTAAAKELHYTQPSVSHHLARLEAETGTRLMQKAGRGIRLAGFSSVLSSLVPQAAALLAEQHPGIEVSLTDVHPEDALDLLRTGQIEVALIFRYDETAPEDGVRLTHLMDDPLFLLTTGGGTELLDHRDSTWIAGCERYSCHLVELCESAGFSPRLGYTSDDMVVMQCLVAAGMGVTTIPGLALDAHRHPAITTTPIDAPPRRIYAATYGEPPDPPATAALLDALTAVPKAFIGQN